MKTTLKGSIAAACLVLFVAGGLRAQTVGGGRRAAIEAEFRAELARVEAAKIARLGELAAARTDAEAAGIYADLFRFAVATEQYAAAEPFAAKAAARTALPVETLLLARMVEVVARAERGDFDGSIALLAKGVNEGLDAAKGAKALPLPARLSLLNAYVQRLVHRGRYDVARRALDIVRNGSGEPRIKELAAERAAQLELVGKPAPAFSGVDLDGKAVKSSDFKGQAVLVLFWATWVPANVAEAGRFAELLKRYEGKGFRIVGVNLDAKGGEAPDPTTMAAVKRFLSENEVRWPNLVNGSGDKDYATLFRVTQLPADVLIGRDGTIIHLDLDVERLKTVLESL